MGLFVLWKQNAENYNVELNKMFLSNPKLNVLFQYLERKAKGLKGTDLLKKDNSYSAPWNETFGLQQMNLSGNKGSLVNYRLKGLVVIS